MHIIWKRPDGFQNSIPEDFRRVGLSNGAQLWLHRYDQDWYPFQVSGDWSGEDDTKKLNQYINRLDSTTSAWKSYLEHSNDNEINVQLTLSEIANKNVEWLYSLESLIKGNTWEVDIIRCALRDVIEKIKIFTTEAQTETK